MKKLFLYLLLLLPLASCSVEVHPDYYPPEQPELVTNIRFGGPYGNIVAVVVNNEIREGSYYGPTVAVVDGNMIYENNIYGRALAAIDGNYIVDYYGKDMAFISGNYILEAPYGRTMGYMDYNPDPVAGGLGAVYIRLFY